MFQKTLPILVRLKKFRAQKNIYGPPRVTTVFYITSNAFTKEETCSPLSVNSTTQANLILCLHKTLKVNNNNN